MKLDNLSEVLDSYLGERTILKYETNRLTAVGENYGSEILSLTLHLETKDGKTEEVHAVAKLPPPGDFIKKVFNTPVTFQIETDFYQLVVPELKQFLNESNSSECLNFFPEFLGARISPNIDDWALILENLKIRGYEMVDKSKGFDMVTTRTILTAMAKFHAIPLAFKLQKPEEFQSRIKYLFKPYTTFEIDQKTIDEIMTLKVNLVENIDNIKRYSERVKEALSSSLAVFTKTSSDLFLEPLATIIHTDAWVNNFMVNLAKNTCKIVDFQLNEYGSPLRDFAFFVFTSIENAIVRESFNELFQLYHQTFCEVLQNFGCDVEPFSYDVFQKEIIRVVRQTEFFHCLMMLEPIFATKKDVKELGDWKEEDLTVQREVTEEYKAKLTLIVEEFAKRDWI